MPQFLKMRYNETVAIIMAIFWLFLYIFVNLTSILYLGTIAINNLSGGNHFHIIMISMAVFSLIISIGGKNDYYCCYCFSCYYYYYCCCCKV